MAAENAAGLLLGRVIRQRDSAFTAFSAAILRTI
jgi:hypothetical protein